MIYLDNAATTLKKPECVRQAVFEAMGQLGNPGRGGHEITMQASRMLYESRETISAFFGLENPFGVVFTSNATESLNIVLSGLFEKGDHAVTTMLEHNSVLRPLYRQAENGVGLAIVPADEKGNISYEEMEEAITEKTKALICTHASNVTGNLTDISRVAAICRKHGILFILDASQTAGEIPISMKKEGIDILCYTGHKGLMGPQGTGGICIRDGITVRPLKVGGSGILSFSRKHPGAMPERLEAGTINGHGIAGLAAAVNYIQEQGQKNITEWERMLSRRFFQKLQDIEKIQLYGDFSAEERAPVVSLNIKDWDSARTADELACRYEIYVRSGAHCAPLMHKALGTEQRGCVRFSFSWFNTPEEAEQAAEAVKELAREK